MAKSLLYQIRPAGNDWPDSFPTGTFLKEERLLDALRDAADKHGLHGDVLVHVYETDGARLGIGQRHLGTINASSVFMAGTVDMERVRS